MRSIITIIVTSAAALLPAAAIAHVTLETREWPANTTVEAVLRIPHGCDGEATHTVRVALPDGFYGAKPMPKAGWALDVVRGPYASPCDDHGTTVSEGPREIVWSGGLLEDAHDDTFVIRGRVGDLAPGTALPFRVTQLCASGSVSWNEVAGTGEDPHDLAYPAPVLTVAGDAHDGASADQSVGAATVGALSISAAWTRATPPGANVAAGYLTITNNGSEPDRLVGGSAPFARDVQVHEMAVVDGMMRMGEIAGGLVVEPGATVTLEPGGNHVMFMGLTDAPKAGATVPVTLRFEKAGEVTLELPVAPIGAGSAPQAGHSHAH